MPVAGTDGQLVTSRVRGLRPLCPSFTRLDDEDVIVSHIRPVEEIKMRNRTRSQTRKRLLQTALFAAVRGAAAAGGSMLVALTAWWLRQG
ncbi:hypothetical protein Sliba_67390 [Streptomyces nigrescens]|uniref:Uncharacterized protein n=1 Tax=Streptomyces nigrescens TaxID=1920 RepID=A0A640TW77_STRNI|nr:hypothetical protein Sliba_67390 [Streptomyces libani subsp. libani]GGV97797.1 hypothetical protein GCM10010500_44140 [Streptomyces libani subsp. libani]